MNMDKLQKRLNISKEELANLLNSGGLYLFDNLDSIYNYYCECGIIDWAKALKDDLKDGTVIHHKNTFIMFA